MRTFGRQSFKSRLASMLKVDFKRMFTMPLIYITAGVCVMMPILILVMTSLMPAAEVDTTTGVEKSVETFTNVWQAIGSVSGGSAMTMDLTGMCNINLVYFLIAVFACIFIADDFRSGYAKNLFTVRSKKTDYCISKTAVCFVGGAIMLAAYFVGAMLGGAIAGLPFAAAGFGAGGIVSCMLSKIFVAAIFVAIALLLGVVAKQRLWISILGSLAAGALLFTMIPMVTPLNSTFLNVAMCLAGGALFAAGLGAVSNLILKKTDLV
ncbi:MAG: ABC transporter permease [Clostridiales bacterium]|nr:ABC transporter permease [Clostridiales bacterium]